MLMLPQTRMLAGLFVVPCVLLIAWTTAHAESAAQRPDCYRVAGGMLVCPQPRSPEGRGDIRLPKPPPPIDNGSSSDRAHAQGTLNASYRISFARIPVGEITVTVVFGDSEYAISARARVGGVMKVLSVDGDSGQPYVCQEYRDATFAHQHDGEGGFGAFTLDGVQLLVFEQGDHQPPQLRVVLDDGPMNSPVSAPLSATQLATVKRR